ncbi:Sur family protein [Megaselia abdita]
MVVTLNGAYFCTDPIPKYLATDICSLNFYQLVCSVSSCMLIAFTSLYLLYKFRDIRNFFLYHNQRACVLIVLFVVNSIEVARSFLAHDKLLLDKLFEHSKSNKSGIYYVIPPYIMGNAFAGISLTVSLVFYHRLLEIKNLPKLLGCSIVAEAASLVCRIYQVYEVTDQYSLFDLESSIQFLTMICYVCLVILDGICIHKVRSHKSAWSIPLQSEKDIGYKHTNSSLYSKALFLWIMPLLLKGSKVPLEFSNLGRLSEEDSSRSHYDRFLLTYKSIKNKTRSWSLWLCYFKCNWKSFTLGGILKVLGDLFALVGPLAIFYIVQYTEGKYSQKYNIGVNFNAHLNRAFTDIGKKRKTFIVMKTSGNITDVAAVSSSTHQNFQVLYNNWEHILYNGWIMAYIVLLTSLIQGVLSQSSSHLLNINGIYIKTSLQGLIYRKVLLLSPKAFQNTNSSLDESKHEDATSDVINLMSDDCGNVMNFFWIIHYVWTIPLKIGVIMFLLYQKLGTSALIGSWVCIFIVSFLQYIIFKAISRNSKIAATYTDERIRKTNDVFMGIKLIKLNAWEKVFLEKIKLLRSNEVSLLNKDSVYWSIITILIHITPIFITVTTLGIYVQINGKENLTSSTLFSAIALFNQLTVPLLIFPVTLPIIISAIISTKRIHKFFIMKEITREFEGITKMARILSKSDASLDVYDDVSVESSSEGIRAAVSSEEIYKIKKNKEIRRSPKKRNDLIRNSRIQRTTRNLNHIKIVTSNQTILQKDLSQIDDDKALVIREGVFSWSNDFNFQMDNIAIPKGKLTVVVGDNGSGKSSFLLALLQEMNKLSGQVLWNKYSSIAYVSQEPWLQNSKIRDNILFGELYRPKRYDLVLNACALKDDLRLMPSGDLTSIKGNGINISGGQKQRIAIARAIYSSSNVVIMDNPLSSLDNITAQHVFENGIQKMLLQQNRTVILVTNNHPILSIADYILLTDRASVKPFATLADLQCSNFNINLKNPADFEEEPIFGKTARERWKLFKNVSKISLQRHLMNKDNEDSSYLNIRRTSSIYKSQNFLYDVSLPIDECKSQNVVLRNNRLSVNFAKIQKEDVKRVRSLQVETGNKITITRNASCPSTLPTTQNKIRLSAGSVNSGFLDFWKRMSSRRSKTSSMHEPQELSDITAITENITEENESIEEVASVTEIKEDEIIQERQYGEIPFNVFLTYFRYCKVPIVIIFFMFMLFSQLMRLYTDQWLQKWSAQEDLSFKVYLALSTLCVFLAILSTPFGQIAGCNARKKLHDRILESFMKKTLLFFQVTPIGNILNRLCYDVGIIDKKIAPTGQRLLQFSLLCFFAVLINVFITPWFLFFTIPILALYYFVQKFYRNSSRELQRLENISASPIISHFAETINGVVTIRAFNQEFNFTEALFRKLDQNSVAFIILNSSNRWLGISLDSLGGFIVFVAIITSLIISKLYPDDPLLPSFIGLAINYTLLIPIYLNWCVKLTADLEMYIGSVERITAYTDNHEMEYNENTERVYRKVAISWPHVGDIVFKNVSLHYQGERQVSNLNLKIPFRQKIAICGKSGSGKSTLCLSLFNLVDASEGQILIDNVDIKDIQPVEIRSRLSIISQDIHIFNCTLRENLDPRKHFMDQDLWNSLEVAELRGYVASLPNGLDTLIGEGGISLSTSKKQLLCLARAVLRGSFCLILDEATSSLDKQNEIKFMEAVQKAYKEKTIIAIAVKFQI